MLFRTLTIVGVGLIGGSIGLAAKKRGLAERIIGVGRDAVKLDQARRLGAIDESMELCEAARIADCVVFCTPVDCIAEQVKSVAGICRREAVLTDAGSTKGEIVAALAASLPAPARFVGAHPLAGSEKKGVDYAHPDLFEKRWTVLTPTAATSVEALASVQSFWQALGSRVRLMTPEDHDRALALTSHLPHLVATALAGMLPEDWRELAATGFRDTTRVAAGDPEIWTPIFQQNRAAVRDALTQLEAKLQEMRGALTANEITRIDHYLTQGKRVRDALGS
jgi:prephenate dehydrogenase